jgi:hypothetical protein
MGSSGLSVLSRLGVCGLVLAGQVIGGGCSWFLLLPLGMLARELPFLNSQVAAVVSFLIALVLFPIAGSYFLSKGFSNYSRPLLVSICSCLAVVSVFTSTAIITRGDRQAAGAMVFPLLVILPTVSLVGSYLVTTMAPGVQERAG